MKMRCALFVVVAFALLGQTARAATPHINSITRIAVDAIGTEPGDLGFYPDVSADGRYVAFTSKASDLVQGDENNCTDVFVYDRFTQSIDRVSVSSSGEEANDGCGSPSISADGRYVAFASWANNLVPGMPVEQHQDTFVHDRQTGTTIHASPSLTGGWGHGHKPSLSGDGQLVAFSSGLGTIISDDTNNTWDVFLRDLDQDGIVRISLDPEGDQFRSESVWLPNGLSSDGVRAVFMVQGKIYCHDRAMGTTHFLDRPWNSTFPSISGNGQFISHATWANGLPPGYAVDVMDAVTGASRYVLAQAGDPGYSGNPPRSELSFDGSKVIFDSVDGMVADDTNRWIDIQLYDEATDSRYVVSRATGGGQSNGNSMYPSISSDGRIVAFVSYASNLVPDDTYGVADVFVYDGTGYRYRIELPVLMR